MPTTHDRPVPLETLAEGDVIFPHLYPIGSVRFGDADCPDCDGLTCDCECDVVDRPEYCSAVLRLRDDKLAEVDPDENPAFADSVERFGGIVNPVCIDDGGGWTREGTLVNGHHRWFYAAERELPVRVTFDAYVGSYNRHPESGERLPGAW